MKPTLIVTPQLLTADKKYQRYTYEGIMDCLQRGETPLVCYPDIFTNVGTDASRSIIHSMLSVTHETAVYTDFGLTFGMRVVIDAAKAHKKHILYRQLIGKTLGSSTELKTKEELLYFG